MQEVDIHSQAEKCGRNRIRKIPRFGTSTMCQEEDERVEKKKWCNKNFLKPQGKQHEDNQHFICAKENE